MNTLYVVANLDNRTILTTRDGADLYNVKEELARAWALHAQCLTNQPHAVVTPTDTTQWLPREVAPWLLRD
jgi:hypothetical protein